jgi:DNA-binding NarL/FixJ family response regulator
MRILLADDHPQLLERVTALLRSSFDVVGTVRNGEELIVEAVRLDPDVIVADISMPVLTGIEAAHQLHEAGSRAKFVFLTVHSEAEFVQACRAEGALGYVVKSRMRADLIPAINAAFSGQSYISQLAS